MRKMETMEERTMIQQYVLHVAMSSMLDHEHDKLKNHQNILQHLYIEINEAVFSRVHQVLADLRKEFKTRDIKIVEGEHQEGVLTYDFWCRGYKGVFRIWREHARSQIGILLGKYSTEIEQKLAAARQL